MTINIETTCCPILADLKKQRPQITLLFHYQEERGSTHWWGPGGGGSANDTLTHPADVLQIKIKSFSTDGRRQKMEFFPADVLPRKYVQKFSDRRRHLKHSKFFGLIWKNFMITWKILPTSFRKNLNKNSQIDVVMWRVRDFTGNMQKLYDIPKKWPENELHIVLHP